MTRLVSICAVVFLVVACSAREPLVEDTAPSDPTSSSPPTTAAPPPVTSTTVVTTTTTVAVTTTTTLEIDVEISGEEIIGPDVFEVTRGGTFDVWVLSDTADELHVHGYDLFFDLTPGVAVNVTFAADIPGIFEVELEGSHTHVFDVEVTG